MGFDTSSRIFDNLSDLRGQKGWSDGAKAIVLNIGTNNEVVGVVWDSQSNVPDNGSTIIQVDNVDIGRWIVKESRLGQVIRDIAKSNASAYWEKVANEEQVTILWRGNSATYGLDTGDGGTLPPINGAPVNRDRNPDNSVDTMQSVLTECLLNAVVVNQGYPYDRTVDALERWSDEPTDGDAIILEYGINDAMNYEDRTSQGYTTVPLPDFKTNLSRMVIDQILLGRRVLLEISPIPEPRFTLQSPGLQSDNYRIRQYAAIVKEIAEQFGVELIDTDFLTNFIQPRFIQDVLKLSWSNLSSNVSAWRGQAMAGTFLCAKPLEGFAGKRYTYQNMAYAMRFIYSPAVPTATVDGKLAQLFPNQTCSMVLDIKDRCELVFRGMIKASPNRTIDVVVGNGVYIPPVTVTVATSGSWEPRYTRTGIILEPGLNTIMLRNTSDNQFLLDQVWLRPPRENTISAPNMITVGDANTEITHEDRYVILPEITADRLLSRHSGESFEGECIIIHNRNTSEFKWTTDRMKDTLGNMVTDLPNGSVTVLQSDGTSNWVILSQTLSVGDISPDILQLVAKSNASAYWEKVRANDALDPVNIIWRGASLVYGQQNGGPGAPINGASQQRTATPSPETMQAALQELGLSDGAAIVHNQGYPGDRSIDAESRWGDDTTAADAIILEYGINDSENYGGRPGGRVPMAQYRETLKNLVIAEILKGRRVIIEIPPFPWAADADGIDDRQQRIRHYMDIAVEVAKQYGCEIFDSNQAVIERSKGYGRWTDNIHSQPSVYAHRGYMMASMFLVAQPPIAVAGSEFAFGDGALLNTFINPSVSFASYNNVVMGIAGNQAVALVLDVKEQLDLNLTAANSSGNPRTLQIQYGSFDPVDITCPHDIDEISFLETGITLYPGRTTVIFRNTTPNTFYVDTIRCTQPKKLIESPSIYKATDANYKVPDTARVVILPQITADRELDVPPGRGFSGETLVFVNQNTSDFKWTIPFNVVLPSIGEGVPHLPNNCVVWTKSDGVDWIMSRELWDIDELIRQTAKSNAANYWQKVRDNDPVNIIYRGDENVYGLDKTATGTLPAINGAPGTETRSSNPTPESIQAVFNFTENGGVALLDATVINQGYPTDRITDGLTRWSGDTTIADAIIISYYIADIYNTGGLPGGAIEPAEYKEALKNMVILEALKGRRVMIELAPIPYDYLGGLHSENHQMRQLHAVAREVAEQFGCEIIDGQQIISEIVGSRWNDTSKRLLSVNAHKLRGWMIAGYFMNAHPKKVYAGDKYSYAEQLFWFSGSVSGATAATYDGEIALIGEGSRVMVVEAQERVQMKVRTWRSDTSSTSEFRRGIDAVETINVAAGSGELDEHQLNFILHPGINVIMITCTSWVDVPGEEVDDNMLYIDEISFKIPDSDLPGVSNLQQVTDVSNVTTNTIQAAPAVSGNELTTLTQVSGLIAAISKSWTEITDKPTLIQWIDADDAGLVTRISLARNIRQQFAGDVNTITTTGIGHIYSTGSTNLPVAQNGAIYTSWKDNSVNGGRTMMFISTNETDQFWFRRASSSGNWGGWMQVASRAWADGKFVGMDPAAIAIGPNSFDGDMDTITTTSVGYIASTATNRPGGATFGGTLSTILYNSGSGYFSQQFISVNGNDEFFYRSKNNGVNGSWFRVASRAWVASQSYLTSTSLSNYYTKTETNGNFISSTNTINGSLTVINANQGVDLNNIGGSNAFYTNVTGNPNTPVTGPVLSLQASSKFGGQIQIQAGNSTGDIDSFYYRSTYSDGSGSWLRVLSRNYLNSDILPKLVSTYLNSATNAIPQTEQYTGNLNTLEANGFGYINNSTTNKPASFTLGGTLTSIFLDASNGYGSQSAISANADDEFFFRRVTNGTWGNWYRVASREWVSTQFTTITTATFTPVLRGYRGPQTGDVTPSQHAISNYTATGRYWKSGANVYILVNVTWDPSTVSPTDNIAILTIADLPFEIATGSAGSYVGADGALKQNDDLNGFFKSVLIQHVDPTFGQEIHIYNEDGSYKTCSYLTGVAAGTWQMSVMVQYLTEDV